MKLDEYLKLNDVLFEEWRNKANHQNQPFIDDGIINPAVWFAADPSIPKILLVLKEAYNGPYSLTRELSKDGPWSAMWNRVAEWSYGLLNYNSSTKELPDYKVLSHKEANECLNQIAVMNLKKSNGTKSSADGSFMQYATDDVELLRKQYQLINPDIIIYGHTFDAADGIHGLSRNKKDNPNPHWYYKDSKNKLHIDFFHPANYSSALLQYYGLMGIYHKSLND